MSTTSGWDRIERKKNRNAHKNRIWPRKKMPKWTYEHTSKNLWNKINKRQSRKISYAYGCFIHLKHLISCHFRSTIVLWAVDRSCSSNIVWVCVMWMYKRATVWMSSNLHELEKLYGIFELNWNKAYQKYTHNVTLVSLDM